MSRDCEVCGSSFSMESELNTHLKEMASHNAALLEAAILVCDTFEMGGSTTKAWLALKAAIAKAKAKPEGPNWTDIRAQGYEK